MGQVSAEGVSIAKRFTAELEKHNIHVQSVILFGSHASGRQYEWSDIDLAVVSNDFEGNPFSDRQKMAKAIWAVDTRVEPHPYRPEEFTEDDLFVQEILKTGIKIV